MTPFIVPAWLMRWASLHGIDWTRWSYSDALAAEQIAREEEWLACHTEAYR